MPELSQLKYLVCISENKTMSKAAEILHISQPALSRSMQKMEEELGVELFTHTGNRVSLNNNGKLAVRHAKKILKEMDTMKDEIIALDQSSHTISIATCTPSPLWTLEPLIHKIYPEMLVKSHVCNTEKLLSELYKKESQIVLSTEPVCSSDVLCLPYTREDLMLSLPENHPLSSRKVIHFNDLAGETMLLYSKIGFWHDLHARKTPHTRYLLQDERSIFNEIVKSSALPSYTTNLAIQKEGPATNRIIIPIDEPEAHVTYYLVMLKKNRIHYKKLLEEITDRQVHSSSL